MSNHSRTKRQPTDNFRYQYDQPKPDYRQYDKPVALTDNHRRYHSLLKNPAKKIVIASGYAGVGKTRVAAYYASQALIAGKVKSIILVRSLEGVGKSPGAYPGSDTEKNEPKLRQLLKYIASDMNQDTDTLVLTKQVVICGLFDIQGSDFSDSYVIVTEAQTITKEEMYILLTRGAYKIVLEGDTLAKGQCVNRSIKFGDDGLSYLFNKIGDMEFVGQVKLDNKEDIVRNDYIKDIIIRFSE